MPDTFDHLYTAAARRVQPSAIREICHLLERPEMKSLAGGWPDAAVFPNTEVAEIVAEVLAREPGKVLQYGATEGLRPLRLALAQWARDREGIAASTESIIVLHGSQQGMDLCARVFIEPGDLVFCESPTYFGGTGAVRAQGGEVVGIGMDAEGLKTDELARKLAELKAQGRTIKGLYTIPNFQNPSGRCLSLPRRLELLRLAREYDFLVFEDDPYGDLRYEGVRLPSLASLDTTGRVIHIHSLSKTFCPGLRLAWLHAEPGILRKLVIAKQFVDACTNSLSQYVALEFIERGLLTARIAANIAFYRPKRDFMRDALVRHFPSNARYDVPAGGFFYFIELPEPLNGDALLREAVTRNVAFVAGACFYPEAGRGLNTIRLSFAQAPIGDIEAAIATLGTLLHEKLAEGTRP